MRISDSMLSQSYSYNLNNSLEKLDKMQTQMSTQKTYQLPSDNPNAARRVITLQDKLSQVKTYQTNISDSLTFMNETTSTMDSMNDLMTQALSNLTTVKNGSQDSSDLNNYADKFSATLKSLLDYANTTYNDQYLFAGTDNSTKPFDYNSDSSAVDIKSDITGDLNVRVSQSSIQKINVSGSDLFSTIVTQNGNLNTSDVVGNTTNSSTAIYGSDGKAYTLNLTYKKTDADTYSMNYDIVNGSGTSVYSTPQASLELKFDSGTGKLQTINGNAPDKINIKSSAQGIDFLLDSSSLTVKNSAASMTYSANQKTNIFNTLIQIKNELKSGTLPTDEQQTAVQNFLNNLINQESAIGNVQDQLDSTNTMLTTNVTNLTSLISKQADVDVAKLTIDLQSQETALQATYKIASMVLPKSLLDYL